jgi:hypothetical protein
VRGKEVENGEASEAKKHLGQDTDAEDIDEEEKLVTNSFKVDLIAEYGNLQEELILHWAISKKNIGEWNNVDDRYIPRDTTIFRDGKACQTKFIKDPKIP